jgi:hypothetical protein
MSKAVRAAVLAVVVLAGCSGGGGKQAVAPTTTTVAPSTSDATPTTQSQEAQVKQAYLDYWQMVDRLIATPNPSDPELQQRAVDPVLSSLRDDLTTRLSEGRTTRLPSNSRYSHFVGSTSTTGNQATVDDCFIDDRVQYASDGTVLNDRVSTVHATGHLVLDKAWLVTDVRTERVGDASVGCG